MLGNKTILFVCFLYCINNIRSEESEEYEENEESYQSVAVKYLTYNDDTNYDVTTIYRIEDNCIPNLDDLAGSGFREKNFWNAFNGNYSIDVNLRTNAVGLPINKKIKCNNNILDIFDDNLLQNNISSKFVTYSTRYWNAQYSNTTANENNLQNQCLDVAYVYSTERFFTYYYYKNCIDRISETKFFSFTWTHTNESIFCLSFIYKLKSSNLKYKLVVDDQYLKRKIISIELEKGEGIKTMKLNNLNLMKGREYIFSLVYYSDSNLCDYYYSEELRFSLMRISQCSSTDQDTTQTVSFQQMNGLKHPYSFNIIGVGKTIQQYGYNEITNGCLNGGFNSNKTSKCICPPGFKGQFCETGCGPNSFGADCMGGCSIRADRMCRGMLMCTAYGCTCPVGLTGPWCNKDCQSGKYGADCKQTCSSNCYNKMCDKYTGICSRGCSPGYILPYCLEKYPYFINPPELISSQYESIQIKLNLNTTNFKTGNTNIELKYYQIYYKILGEESYSTSEFNLILNDMEMTSTIRDLEPGTTYEIGALLITNDGNYNIQDVRYGQYNTLCAQPRIDDYNVKLISGIKSVNITWDDIQPSRIECHVTEYILTVMSDKFEKQEIISVSNNNHYLNNLLPNVEYKIRITAKTNNGLIESSQTYLAIPLMKENDAEITNISTEITNGSIKIFWKLLNPYHHYSASLNGPVTITVKYKLTRVFSCLWREIENEWTSVKIVNKTNYEIFNTVSNSQYAIQVIVGDYDLNETYNIFYALTPTSSPETKPILDIDHPMFVTNNSVYVKWKVDLDECSKLNGFFSTYYFELKDIKENSIRTNETKQNNILIDNLKSNTLYELKIFIKTSFGYNPEYYLAIDFKTKNENLEPVDDLMVYKKSLKSRMVGLRWSYLENTTINGFLVSFDENSFTNISNSFIIPPEKCLAWPEYYCHTFQNMTFNKTYTFKIKPTSVDYPDGGKVSSITFSSIDGLPDSPTNIKTTKIDNTTIHLRWDIPWTFNGVLKTFIINVEEISSVDINSCCASIVPIEIPISEELPTYNYTLEDLRPGSTYSIGIIAVSKSLWYSSPARISATTLV